MALAVCVLAVAGCETGPTADESTPRPPPDAAVVRRVIEVHNRRLEQLQSFAARGVIEFRWTDDSGDRHFEPQINGQLWIELPRRTALSGQKLGETYLWLGSDEERYWMFDATAATSRLVVGRHEEPLDDSPTLMVRPLSLLDLLGLVELHVTPPAAAGPLDLSEPPTTGAGGDDAIVVSTRGAGGLVRVHLDPETSWPIRVETLAEDGRVLLTSTLSRYRAVEIPGLSALARPRMATLIDIADPAGTVAIKLALGEMSDQTIERVFDLERLAEHLQPDEVEGIDP